MKPLELPALFGVVGNPVAHSLSPAMHNAAFEALDIPAVYLRLQARDAKSALRTARSMGMRALNITAPFKEDFAKLAGKLSPEAKAVGAVNTLDLRPKNSIGYNTDIDGVISSFRSAQLPIRGRTAVVLGAGGAARAAAYALLSAGANVTIANRTADKARQLARQLGCRVVSLNPEQLGPVLAEAELIVSTLSTAERVIPAKLLAPQSVLLDAVYGSETALARDALRRGCGVLDGRSWLVYQGALAFRVFTGLVPPLGDMWHGLSEKQRPKRNLALIGLPGAGKSQVARELGKISELATLDLDAQIERAAKKSIPEIFAKAGEKGFRKLEREQLAKAVKRRGVVLACGGGAVVDPKNFAALHSSCLVIWLWAEPKGCAKRIEPGTRPLLHGRSPLARLEKLLKDRKGAYARACDLVVDTEGMTAREVARQVLGAWE